MTNLFPYSRLIHLTYKVVQLGGKEWKVVKKLGSTVKESIKDGQQPCDMHLCVDVSKVYPIFLLVGQA